MMKLVVVACILMCALSAQGIPSLLEPLIVSPSGYHILSRSGNSTLYEVDVPAVNAVGGQYDTAPLLVHLRGTRFQIGYDYAALLQQQSHDTLTAFTTTAFPSPTDRELILLFVDYCWDTFLSKHVPVGFAQELEGMAAFTAQHGGPRVDIVAQRFFTLANMPADNVNIIAMLEQEEEKGWPQWLKNDVNYIVGLLETLGHHCDAFGVWGSRTEGSLLYSSRNLDYMPNTGINRHKLVIVYDIDDPEVVGPYTSIGFAFGPGALAGMSKAGVTTSEMNLDNSAVTFDGLAFPLRLRYVLERATDLQSAMVAWNSTANTNSFNFLLGSAADARRGNNAAYALETIRDFTAVFPANSPVERAATFDCPGTTCHKWTSQSGIVHIGKPMPEAVWRANHGMSPTIMATQEPLFNNTVFRYDLMAEIFQGFGSAGVLINDTIAVNIVATLGTKGVNYLTCDQPLIGDNIMSIAYAPGPRLSSAAGHFYVAWESGSGSSWRPAACSPYVRFDMSFFGWN